MSGGQGGAAAPAAPAAAPAPEPLEPAVPAHRLPQRRRGRSPAVGLVSAAGRAPALLGGRLGLWGSCGLSSGHGHHGLSRPGRGNCGKIASRSAGGLIGSVAGASAALGSSSRAACLLSLAGLLVIRHFRFSSSGPSFVWVEEEGEGDAGFSGVHLVAIYVGQFEIQRSEGDRAAQLHQVPVVRLVLHDVAHALVDDHLADYVGAQRPQDVRRVAQLPGLEVNLVERVPGDPKEDLKGTVDVAAPQQVVDALGAGGIGPLGVAGAVGEEVAELGV